MEVDDKGLGILLSLELLSSLLNDDGRLNNGLRGTIYRFYDVLESSSIGGSFSFGSSSSGSGIGIRIINRVYNVRDISVGESDLGVHVLAESTVLVCDEGIPDGKELRNSAQNHLNIVDVGDGVNGGVEDDGKLNDLASVVDTSDGKSGSGLVDVVAGRNAVSLELELLVGSRGEEEGFLSGGPVKDKAVDVLSPVVILEVRLLTEFKGGYLGVISVGQFLKLGTSSSGKDTAGWLPDTIGHTDLALGASNSDLVLASVGVGDTVGKDSSSSFDGSVISFFLDSDGNGTTRR